MPVQEKKPVYESDAELHRKMRALYSHDQYAIHDRVLTFHDHLKEKYPDYRQYQLVHLISGSTVQGPFVRYDFPGEDSVEAFVGREYERVFGPTA